MSILKIFLEKIKASTPSSPTPHPGRLSRRYQSRLGPDSNRPQMGTPVTICSRSELEVTEELFAEDAPSRRPVLYAFASFSAWRAIDRPPRTLALGLAPREPTATTASDKRWGRLNSNSRPVAATPCPCDDRCHIQKLLRLQRRPINGLNDLIEKSSRQLQPFRPSEAVCR